MHLFWGCKVVRKFWAEVFETVNNRFQLQMVDLNWQDIVINRLKHPVSHIGNFICLIVKQYIYRQRCMKKELIVPQFKAYLNNIENMEKYIAVKNGKISNHNIKWRICIGQGRNTIGIQEDNLNDFVMRYVVNM